MTGPLSPQPEVRELISSMDLTSLGGSDGPVEVRRLCERAMNPLDGAEGLQVAAVCVWPRWAGLAREQLNGSGVAVACVAGGFPDAQSFIECRCEELRRARAEGAQEFDVLFDRGLWFAGEEARAREELGALREAAGDGVLKVILETGAFSDTHQLRAAANMVLEVGANFLKTSTGRLEPGVTIESAVLLSDVIRAAEAERGQRAGLKVSGGIRTEGQARSLLEVARATFGASNFGPHRFRLGASSLLDAIAK